MTAQLFDTVPADVAPVCDVGGPFPARPIILLCWRCPCVGPDLVTYDPDWPGKVSGYHHPRECEHGSSYVIILERSNYKPRPWQPPKSARRARKETA